MTTGTFVWMVIYAIAAILFFGVACVITVIGLRDLKDLLARSVKSK